MRARRPLCSGKLKSMTRNIRLSARCVRLRRSRAHQLSHKISVAAPLAPPRPEVTTTQTSHRPSAQEQQAHAKLADLKKGRQEEANLIVFLLDEVAWMDLRFSLKSALPTTRLPVTT